MDAISLIEQKARDKGVSIASVCRELGLKRMYISRWKKSKPTSLKYIDAINAYLDGMDK
jgi:transposase-like protein